MKMRRTARLKQHGVREVYQHRQRGESELKLHNGFFPRAEPRPEVCPCVGRMSVEIVR